MNDKKTGCFTINGNSYWYLDGLLHNHEGPAVIWSNGTKEWYQNGLQHRLNAPAVTDPNGHEEWWSRGKLHREGGPAVTYADGTQEWWWEGTLHREDGPAVTSTFSDYCEWHVHDVEMTEEEFNIWVSKNKLHQKLLTKLEAKDDDKKTKI